MKFCKHATCITYLVYGTSHVDGQVVDCMLSDEGFSYFVSKHTGMSLSICSLDGGTFKLKVKEINPSSTNT